MPKFLMDKLYTVLNCNLSLSNLISGKTTKKLHIDDEHEDSKIRRFFSADEQAEALEELTKKFDTRYLTDLSKINPVFEEYIKQEERDTRISKGLHNEELKEKFDSLDADIKKLAQHPPLERDTENLKTDRSLDSEDITIDKLHDRVKEIKEKLQAQLDKDIGHIESLFSKPPAAETPFQAALKALTPPDNKPLMSSKEIHELKADMLAAVHDAHKKAVDTFNQELEDQYQKAENDHNLLLILAVVLKTDKKMANKFQELITTAEMNAAAGLADSAISSSVTGSDIKKIDRDVAKKIVYNPLRTKDDMGWFDKPWFSPIPEDAFFTSITGQAIRHSKKDNHTLYRIQFPARIPCGPVARCLSELVFGVHLTGNPFSNYYSNRQDNIKIEYLSMTERLWAEGYRKAEIRIDHNPGGKDMTHALEHAQKAAAACCEAGFKVEDLTFIINGKKLDLYEEHNEKGEITKMGIFKSEAAMNAMVEKAKFKVKAKEDTRPSEMREIKKTVSEFRAAREQAAENAKKEEEAESDTLKKKP